MTMHTGASHSRQARSNTIATRQARTLKRDDTAGNLRITRAGHVKRMGMGQ